MHIVASISTRTHIVQYFFGRLSDIFLSEEVVVNILTCRRRHPKNRQKKKQCITDAAADR